MHILFYQSNSTELMRYEMTSNFRSSAWTGHVRNKYMTGRL